MGKRICIFAITVATILVLAHFVNGAAMAATNNFRLIGTIHSTSSQQASGYFLSQNAAGWSTAMKDCKQIFGKDASLLNIETYHELVQVNKFLQGNDTGTGTVYWSGGRYNQEEKIFRWDTGVKFEKWAPWDEGFPKAKFSTTRVSIVRHPTKAIQLQTYFNTVSLRYICEYKGALVNIVGVN